MTGGGWSADLELTLDAVTAAGERVMLEFRTDQAVRHKGPDQPVTDSDLAADAILRDRLLGARPGYGWLSEETVDRPDRLALDRVWIVDPIDGTRSYIAGYREFGISVGLAEAGRAVLGVIHNPATGELFWAVRGGGAFRAVRSAAAPGGARRLAVADASPGEPPRMLASRSEIRRGELGPFEEGWRIEPLGSTAYKMACVAAGGGQAFVSRGPKSEWDLAAGEVIVEEAGGIVTDLRGAGLDFNRPDPYVHGLVVATPGTHAALLARTRELPSPRLRGDGMGMDRGQEGGCSTC